MQNLTFASRAQVLEFFYEAIGVLRERAKRRREKACGQVRDMAVRQPGAIRNRIAWITRTERALSNLAACRPPSGDIKQCPTIVSPSQPG